MFQLNLFLQSDMDFGVINPFNILYRHTFDVKAVPFFQPVASDQFKISGTSPIERGDLFYVLRPQYLRPLT